MKRSLPAVFLLLLVATALGYLWRQPLKAFAYSVLTQDMFVARDTDAFDPGPVLGSRFPGLRASYRGRDITLIEEFAGRNGTVFIASRSLDWCPYCMRQMIQLQQHRAQFEAAGIGLVAMTYDPPQLQQAFIDRHGITIALLSDTDGLSFKTLGILNEQYRRGDSEYGIPHPGMIVINPQGKVVGKLFLEDYSVRVDSAAALAFSRQVLGIR
ncbi:MAG: peroxiredoxin family protein [Halioglobus sp.]|nr:peroxiredoxin family protein [Halioglobus sp.]